MKYLSTFEVAEKWGIFHRRVGILYNENRIPGAQRAGGRWIIPEDAEKSADARIKSGKYIKSKNKRLMPIGKEAQSMERKYLFYPIVVLQIFSHQ